MSDLISIGLSDDSELFSFLSVGFGITGTSILCSGTSGLGTAGTIYAKKVLDEEYNLVHNTTLLQENFMKNKTMRYKLRKRIKNKKEKTLKSHMSVKIISLRAQGNWLLNLQMFQLHLL